MAANPRLLVVDDEEVICRGCWRVFSRQGFQVETTGDPVEGLGLANENDYAAILLDVKMPTLDGIQFLRELRKNKPDVPVLFITGYPNIPDAAAAMRLGAADYVTKPFSPEEITRAVQSLLRYPEVKEAGGPGAAAAAETWAPASEDVHFRDEAWYQTGRDGSVRVGAILKRSQAAEIEAVRLPRLGEIVYQGLPLAGLTTSGGQQRTVPSPVSGVVVAVNEAVAKNPTTVWSGPRGDGWLVCLSPTRIEQDAKSCSIRRVILANADETSAQEQRRHMVSLGCQVRVVRRWEELAQGLHEPDGHLLVIDAASFGEDDPQLVRRIRAAAPSIKVVVVASPGSDWEAAHREGKIFRYTAKPFKDEAVDILNAAFASEAEPLVPPEGSQGSPKFMCGIWMTNRNGEKVRLLTENRLLRWRHGLGWLIERRLREALYPIEPVLGAGDISPMKLVKAAGTCDRLLVLLAKDTGRLPGSLLRDTKGEFVSVAGEGAGRVTGLVVQPESSGDAPLEFDARTTMALAEHVVREMALS